MEDKVSELRLLMRELVMRAQLALPINEQDDKWFNTGFKGDDHSELRKKVFKEIFHGEKEDSFE